MIGERALRAILAVIAVYHVVQGLLALLAPDTFFDDIGRYGVENSHYVGDVGAFGAFAAAWLARVSERLNDEAPASR